VECIFKLTISMLHYIVMLHALRFNIRNNVTCVYNLYTVSSGSVDTASLLSVFLMYYLLL